MMQDYLSALKAARKDYRKNVSLKETKYLPALDALLPEKKLKEAVYLTRQEIPLSMVVGTVHSSRSESFSSNFLPLLSENTEFAAKWSALYDSMVLEGQRDPVKVYEYLFHFYVEEGNKRLSVLKYLDQISVDAEIYRIRPEKEEAEAALYEEFVSFYEAVPTYALRFHKEGSYREFANLAGIDLNKKYTEEEVRKVEAGYYRFYEVFQSLDEAVLLPYAADCFLIYCRLYSFESVLNLNRTLLENRLLLLREEFRTAFLKEKEELSEEKEEIREKKHFFRQMNYDEAHPLRADFFYSGSLENSAWLIAHEEGRKYAEEALKGICELRKHENLDTEEALIKAMNEAVLQGSRLLFTVSNTDLNAAVKIALSYPDVSVYNCSLHTSHSRVHTYYAKSYEVRFLLGVLAGALTTNHKVGYVADYPLMGTVANINAFALGVAFADPFAQVYLRFSTVGNYDWREEMKKNHVSVISGHELVKPAWGSAEKGLYYLDENGEHVSVATVQVNWGRYYEEILRAIINGNETSVANTWYGLSSGVVSLRLSDELPEAVKRTLKKQETLIVTGKYHPFTGALYDQKGILRCAQDTVLTSEEIIHMAWLNENIDGELPKMEEYLKEAQKTIAVSGLPEVKRK